MRKKKIDVESEKREDSEATRYNRDLIGRQQGNGFSAMRCRYSVLWKED